MIKMNTWLKGSAFFIYLLYDFRDSYCCVYSPFEFLSLEKYRYKIRTVRKAVLKNYEKELEPIEKTLKIENFHKYFIEMFFINKEIKLDNNLKRIND